ncbi:MAG: resolvase [Robiginitomaculum sp.]|nr:MAG: resolvase [Robiginitomaculum sp.]
MGGYKAPPAAYLRVSTLRQGMSGLGLDAQRKAIETLLDGQSYKEFIEIESGKKSKRPELEKAIDYCRKHKAKLVIAKLDRLARNVHFISGLMETGVDFLAVDMPNADRFMLHVYAAMAEEEGRRISERTKAALAAAKERGVELGRNGKVLAIKNRKEAELFAQAIAMSFDRLGITQDMNLQSIARVLNEGGIKTRKDGIWYKTSVARLLDRV